MEKLPVCTHPLICPECKNGKLVVGIWASVSLNEHGGMVGLAKDYYLPDDADVTCPQCGTEFPYSGLFPESEE